MYKKWLFAASFIVIAIVAIVYLKPGPKYMSLKLGNMHRVLKSSKLVDSFKTTLMAGDLISTQNGLIVFNISSDDSNAFWQIQSDGSEKPIALPYNYKFSRSVQVSGDTATYLYQKEDSLWLVQSINDIIQQDKFLPIGQELSFANLLNVNELAIGMTNDTGIYVLIINIYSDTLQFTLDDKFNYSKPSDSYYPGIIFNGNIYKKENNIIYKSLYSGFGLEMELSNGTYRTFQFLDSLPFPETRKKEVVPGFIVEELYPQVYTNSKTEIKYGNYFVLSVLDKTGTKNAYLDVYNDEFIYMHSYSFPRIKDTKPISFALDYDNDKIIYILYDDIKRIYKYEIN